MSIDDCQLIKLPAVTDPRGNLTFIENGNHIPFDMKRVYYLYDLPSGSERGEHAHKKLKQLIIAISGSFDVLLDDGYNKKVVHLNNPGYGLYVCPLIWRRLDNFSSNAVCFVLASDLYEEADYFRDYQIFLKEVCADNEYTVS